uniref:Uncharacterized protein n=1 Tax=Euplotes harpa TaxID=151035 RepID=A0A7S3JB74_9SPIT|mmetsp:Transcript_30365/g.34789  ORF Transcript_30365/g.34789 Transcript_30365/m.34789 type:complete len:148 (+) Transcript_30365:42-485(+)
MSLFKSMRKLGMLFLIGVVAIIIVSCILFFSTIPKAFSDIEGMIITFQVVHLIVLAIETVLLFFHFIGAWKDMGPVKTFLFRLGKASVISGAIMNAALLTHVTASKEFYGGKDEYNSYFGVAAGSLAFHALIGSMYVFYETTGFISS